VRGDCLEDVAATIEEFAALEKLATASIQWVLEPKTDTAKAQFLVTVPTRPSLSAKVHMAAHVHREPFKYGFSLILGGSDRVVGLDVNPARSHVNLTDLGRASVQCTHWQRWPNGVVDPDDRQRTHSAWFKEFCKRAAIRFTGSYRAPPHLGGEQMRLL
jgi:hypothetical protein